jgi:hypothetical protein
MNDKPSSNPTCSSRRKKAHLFFAQWIGGFSYHSVRVGTLITLASTLWSTLAATNSPATPPEGLLQFIDGSVLHGRLESIQTDQGLTWNYRSAKQPLLFAPTNLATVRFEQAQSAASNFQPNCRFQFQNGDEVIGNLISLQKDTATLESWFGGKLEAPRDSLEAILFSAKAYKLIYEGPTGIEGWRMGRNQRSWEYRDGTFIANGADLLGRDFGLTGSSTLEFDLAWNGAFNLNITLYAQVIDRFDYSTSAYLIYLGTGAVSVQRVQAGAGAFMLGQSQVPSMLRKNKMHFEIRSNKDDATITLLADGQFIQRWRDASGFVAKGGGIVFYSQVEPRGLKLSNIRVAEWEGRFEPETLTNVPPTSDVVFLANKDRVIGEFQKIEEGKLTIKAKQTTLDIPLSRVTQIRFADSKSSASQTNPWDVRASFPGGETVGFELVKWDAEQVTGKSPVFGSVAFKPRTIRQLQFNPRRPTAAAAAPADDSDRDIPEFE